MKEGRLMPSVLQDSRRTVNVRPSACPSFSIGLLHRIAYCALLASLASCQSLSKSGRAQKRDADIPVILQEARVAWGAMQQPDAVASAQARLEYNEAVACLVRELARHEGRPTWAQERRFTGSDSSWHLTFDSQNSQPLPRTWSLSEFAQCKLASEVKLRNFKRVVTKEGLGVPVVLVQDDPGRVSRPFHPPEGEFLPATALIEFPPASRGQPAEARLRFYNPLAVSQVSVGRRSQGLAENLTASMQLSMPESYFDEEDGLLGSMAGGEDEGHLYFPTPYDPSKVPVVFVHGVRSYAGIWKNAVNELLADPELRRRYQPVCFIYPPKMPVPVSAACLRRLLARSREKLDPERDDPGFGRVVLVGHSMGGLLTRLQVIDSGMDIWGAFFAAPPEEIAHTVDAETMIMVRESLIFEHDPGIARVIFLCTPHQGSELADVDVVRTVLRLVLFLPKQVQRQLEALRSLPMRFIKPELREYHDFGLEGQENARTGHPFFKALAKRPIKVPFHSIIAVGDGADALTDGVVPYWSAHLEGAASETVIPYAHSCLWEPETLEAVLGILKRNK
jgi:hypothetical protein